MVNRNQRAPHLMHHPLSRVFFFLGGRLAADFANTVHSPLGHGDALSDWPHLVHFLAGTHLITPDRERALLDWQLSSASTAQELLKTALRLRDAARDALSALADGTAIPEPAIECINEILAITEGHDELSWQGGAWRLQFRAREERVEWLLAALARSAAEIIAEGSAAPVRRCGNPHCGLLFYDTSRTGRRRWCSMSICGNRSKVAAFAKRKAHAPRHRAASA
jgi:predicted RNA-binding Zn ribbon-like protein